MEDWASARTYYVSEVARKLTHADEPDTLQEATLVAQIFSGVFFAGLTMWLSFANGTRLSFIQQASLEKRLTVCCMMTTYVAAFSAFFNFFQLTEVDDIMLPRATQFTLDLARPIEWICTCPIMQLVLVLLGGSRIPEYRRVLMPGLSAAILVIGFSSTLIGGVWQYVMYTLAFLIFGAMSFINRHQIMENSQGQESLAAGDSEFRKATVLVMATWFPFPIWFFLSPEGLGLLDSVLVIQVGWAFLNIVSKFTFIFYIQRIKDNYCNRLKVKREIYGAQAQDRALNNGKMESITPTEQHNKAKGELGAVVVETMSFLGMAQHTDRFMRLLHKADIRSLDQIEHFTKEKCDQLNLPHDLVSALQKRFKVWKLEMTDNAELELEKGELHYASDDPMAHVARKLEGHQNNPGSVPDGCATPPVYVDQPHWMNDNNSVRGGQAASSDPHWMNDNISVRGAPVSTPEADERLKRMEDMMSTLMEKVCVLSASESRKEEADSAMVRRVEQAVSQAIMATKRVQEAEAEGSLRQRMDEMVGAASENLRNVSDKIVRCLDAKIAEYEAFVQGRSRAQADSENLLSKKVESLAQAAERSNRTLEGLCTELSRSDNQNMQARKVEEMDRNLSRKLEELSAKSNDRSERIAEALRSSVQADLSTLMGRTDLVGDAVREASSNQKENTADLRRLCMASLEQLGGVQERCNMCESKITEVRGMVDSGIERISHEVREVHRDHEKDGGRGHHGQEVMTPKGGLSDLSGRGGGALQSAGLAGLSGRRSMVHGGLGQ
eukprot:TRINITY_DN38494_c0_g1_i1.p1 TRINITY_DN38494_c0_g1~~TRINITY_DN38494_c0_g1_i1.p1  ORF type:complete len:781 (+),score=173.08 TRINITY_DN38494_c0_g1_i1:72-2414(+)